jgi:hypothetical protein
MSAISGACQIVRLITSGVGIARDASELANTSSDDKLLLSARIAAITMRTLSLTASACAVGGEAAGASNTSLGAMHTVEFIFRGISMPFQVVESSAEYLNGNLTLLEAIEKGLIAPAAAVTRAHAESVRSHYQHLLELPPDQRLEPVYKTEGIGEDAQLVIDHYRVVTEEECKENILWSNQRITPANLVEIAANTSALSNTGSKLIQIYQNVISLISRQPQPTPAAPVPVPSVPAAPVQAPLAEIDPFEGDFLLRLSIIPDALHEDTVFQRYVCPITQRPIRYPLRGPNGTLYERSAIEEWCRRGEGAMNDPFTRRLTTIQEYAPVPMLQNIIDTRLRWHQEEIRRGIQANLLVP